MGWLKKALGLEPTEEAAFTEITDDNFQAEVIDSDRPVMLFVWSNQCPHCRRMTPNVKQIAARFRDRVRAAHTSGHLAPHTLGSLEVQGVPTTLFFHQGRLVERVVGFRPESFLEELILARFVAKTHSEASPDSGPVGDDQG